MMTSSNIPPSAFVLTNHTLSVIVVKLQRQCDFVIEPQAFDGSLVLVKNKIK